jgi:DNA-binding CsgD family transcriptional regulator
MSQAQGQAPAELDRLIESLYTIAFEHAGPDFRRLALERLCAWAGAGAAAWLTRSTQTVDGEYSSWPEAIPRHAVEAIAFADGHREVLLDAPASDWPHAPGMSGEIVAYSIAHRGTSLHSVVALGFAAGARAPHERLRRAIGHLVQAATLALGQWVRRDEWLHAMGRSSRGAAALVDARGGIYLSGDRFGELLATDFGEQDGRRLPFPLPADTVAAGAGDFAVNGLHFRLQRSGSLLLLHVRRPQPLDALSPRERQIARALAAGKTFKSISREFDIAISTVANHASRIYRKLGIFRREELVGLLRKAVSVDR